MPIIPELMETELWPNLLYYSNKRKVPIVLANARLSAKSFAGYRKVGRFIGSLLNCINIIATQSKADTERFIALGVAPKKIVAAGNVKFDIKIPESLLAHAKKLRLLFGIDRPIWVAASTHAGEEKKILIAAKIVQQTLPNSLLILVPRHPERFNEVFSLCCGQGFNTVCYSEGAKISDKIAIIIGNVMGQLLAFYAASDIAFVGGSLVPWGGHNLLEPAALARPVLSGKNLHAFTEISQQLTAANALIQVDDELGLAQKVIQLFQDKELQEKLGAAALDVVCAHSGATQKILECIKNQLEHKECV